MFLRRIGVHVLPTKENLHHRLGIADTDCVLCKKSTETAQHLFFHLQSI